MSGSRWFFLLQGLSFIRYASLTDVTGATTGVAIAAPDPYQSLSQNHGLFNSSDNVVVLNSKNFKSTIHGSQHSWVVEFYNSWCGFCQRFAPAWKALADDILLWKEIVRIAAIDCADDDNNPLCRDYEIMHYPELLYFGPNEKRESLGKYMEKARDVDGLRKNLLIQMEKEQQEGRGTDWPNITPFRSSEIKDIFNGIRESVKFIFFLFEEPSSSMGAEIILDFHKSTNFVIRRVTSDNNMLCLMYEITRFPSLLVISRDGTKNKNFKLRVPTREMTRNAITEFLISRGIDVPIVKRPENIPLTEKSSAATVRPITISVPQKIQTLHQADLESALRFSFNHEISINKIIEKDKMLALRNYVNALGSYFPMKHGNPMFLNTLSFVIRAKNSTSGEDFRVLVKSTEEEMSPVYTEKNGWVGCKPSKPGLRGYPCGLWTLFHTLTVHFAIKSEEYPNMEATQILEAIYGYVKHFFGCYDCAQHFMKMAETRKMMDVKSADESVLWLWEAHNEVNQRLKDDSTTDPEYPKIQYPSKYDCPECRDDYNQWDKREVLKFLKNHYSYSSDTRRHDSSTVGVDSQQEHRNKPRAAAQEETHFNDRNGATRKFGWDFTIFDISICVVLYVTSASILMLVCIKFAVKRSSLKKKSLYSRVNNGKV